MIKIDLDGKEVWCLAAEMTGLESELIHDEFPAEIREILAEIKEAFDPYFAKTMEEWEDGFRRDSDPVKEIAIWLVGAQKIKMHAPGGVTPRNHEVYRLVMNAMINGTADALVTFTPEHLSKEEISQILGPDK